MVYIFWEPIIWSDTLYFGLGYDRSFGVKLLGAFWVSIAIYFMGNFAFIFARKSVIYMLIYSELILLGINLLYVFLSVATNEVDTQVIIFKVIAHEIYNILSISSFIISLCFL